ncbi:MAG: hypothetical protein JOZ78_20515 [Chroococcidiopsidaceae cyanobacterium CP_BM_ER_R8_30]|nr:hypothetical protein [Chroococcidiopsidaceae cyanobacterium CP_BM_ER_R8_30]
MGLTLALDEAVHQDQIQPGDIIATARFRAGLSWGAAIIRMGRSSTQVSRNT